MNDHPFLDPDDAAASRAVQDALLESLDPAPLSLETAGAIRQRLLARIRASREAGKALIQIRLEDGEWENLLPGVRVKHLAGGGLAGGSLAGGSPGEGRGAALFELQPGAVIPFHRHHEDEECVVLRGEVQLGEVTVRAGDYHFATAGSRHGAVRSARGALLYLRGTPIGHPLEVARDVLMGLLPGRGEAPRTLHRDAGEWREQAPGVRCKLLRDDVHGRAMLLSLAPGATAELAQQARDEECLVMEGEAFVADRLLRPGDYQLAPPGAGPRSLGSERGSLLFVRAAA